MSRLRRNRQHRPRGGDDPAGIGDLSGVRWHGREDFLMVVWSLGLTVLIVVTVLLTALIADWWDGD